MTMFGAWFGLLGAATLGGMLVLDISGVRPQRLWRLSTLPPSRQRWVLLLERLSLACWALWALIVSLQQLRVLPSQSGSMVAQHVIVVVGLAAVAGLVMIYQFGGGWRAVSEETIVQVIRRASSLVPSSGTPCGRPRNVCCGSPRQHAGVGPQHTA
jgi:hypothetical protein